MVGEWAKFAVSFASSSDPCSKNLAVVCLNFGMCFSTFLLFVGLNGLDIVEGIAATLSLINERKE